MALPRPHISQIVFIPTIFLSAGLLFFVQPLFAKLVLPFVGGSSSVWTTAMLFFQTVLLLGYIYAHLSTKYLSVFWQIALHIGLWAVALLFVPLSVKSNWIADTSTISTTNTLLIFATGVGLPFAVLSANAPLIQKWYSRSGGPSADDPYFLYSASNLGSLIALLAFPLIGEPLLGARMIGLIWAAGFVILGGMLFWSGRLARQNNIVISKSVDAAPLGAAPNNLQRLYWIILAAIPSSLMLAVTSKISADIGSFPLVWIIPLALYLVSFIIAFSGKRFISQQRQAVLIPACLIFLLFATRIEGISAVGWTNFTILIATFFVLAIIAHKRLYDARPSENHLTQFYIFMSLGGAMGGFFNSIIATHMFNDIHEVPIVIAAASILIWTGKTKPTQNDFIRAIIFAVIAISVALLLPSLIRGTLAQPNLIAVTFVGFLLIFILKNKEWQTAISLALFILVTYFATQSNHIYQSRSVFGVHRILEEDGIRKYLNGTTLHGAERISEHGTRPTPLTYYHPNGPMGRIMQAAQTPDTTSIGIVGLGVGSLTCYRQDHQKWDLYEIDPVVDDIARDPKLFNFMDQCAPDIPTHIGDARLVLAKQAPKNFDILLIDAFSSDAIPVHLITKEAIELYLSHMNDNGVLVMHISNRYFALQKPLSKIASELGLIALGTNHIPETKDDNADQASAVTVFARNQIAINRFIKDDKWRPLISNYRHLWTDDYSNLLSTLR
ncbi:hypothetical protein GCM10008927_04140 [Amylibacter ulvae]|uniref:Spermidine synthase n=1 Tax=Paramylibacter ulvae TaxID=1651968 RepID=A0ABQ3CT75_9RHOB|nr:fused MFS/spermidine synthase [Amylibacter ulvae]GHA42793.1 hypothetical protein GCM10008927_04140 [Amylibacter ulvae]